VRGGSGDADGSGAPSTGLGNLGNAWYIATLVSLAAILALWLAPMAQAEEEEGTPQLANIGEIGKVNPEDSAVMAPGEWRYINGIAVNYTTGNVYLLDPNMSRVQVYNPSGELLFTFGEEGTGAGQLGKYSSGGVAIDHETGDVYVGEGAGPLSNNRVSKWTEDGEFILTFGKEVNATTEGDICTAASGNVCRAGTVHEHQKEGEIAQAVPSVNQQTHAVYVPAPSLGKIQEFSQGGLFLSAFAAPEVGGGVEAGPEFLYGQAQNGQLDKWTQSGSLLGPFSPLFASGEYTVPYAANPVLAPGSNVPGEERLFASMYNTQLERGSVGEWNLAGELLQEHAPGLPSGQYVAVDPTTGRIYTTQGYPDGRVFVLGHPATLPNVAVQAATLVTNRSAVLNGTVNPEGSNFPTGWHFEYKRAVDSKWQNAPQPGGGVENFDVTGSPTGGTFKLSWAAPYLPEEGQQPEEQTGPIPYNATPAEVEAALLALQNLSPGDVTVSGAPGSWIVTIEGRYTGEPLSLINVESNLTGGTNPEVVRGTPQNGVNVGKGTSTVPVSVKLEGLEGLQPNTEYEYRLVGTRTEGGGGQISEVESFTTDAIAPALSRIAPSHVTDSTATLQGVVNPEHSQTSYYFEYGTDESYGTKLPAGEGDAGNQLGEGSVFANLTELAPDTEYHFRLVAVNPGGTTEGPDQTFHTRTPGEEVWPARDIELVNTPDKGDQNAARGTFELEGTRAGNVSPDGNEVLWGTLSGTPESTTGYRTLTIATRTPTGWKNHAVGVPASEQAGGGDLAYNTEAVAADYSTFVMSAESGFFSSNHPHVWERVTRNGEQQEIEDTGNQVLTEINISDNGEHITYIDPLSGELMDFHDGTAHPVVAPSCGVEGTGSRYPNVSGDLSRLFVHSKGNEPECEAPGVYMINTKANTVTEIAPEGRFIRANSAGTRVVFLKNASGEGFPNEDYEFYEWSEGNGIECLSCGEMPGIAPGRGVENVGVSEDLSHVYFWIRNLGGGCESGRFYVIYEGKVNFVARAGDAGGVCFGEADLNMTPDGSELLFPSNENPTSGDETGGFAQVYLYNDHSGYTECVSCSGHAGPQDGGLAGGVLNGHYAISADGRTAAFATTASMVPADINQGMDVYEWHAGRTRLITDGESEFRPGIFTEPELWGASKDGKVVIFSEGGVHITGNEKDDYTNVYAAVLGGPGFPPPNEPAHCVEDSCQGPLQAPPNLETQGSEKFRGQANPAPRRHRKHRHRRHHHKHRHHKHRHHKHGGNG
jgi:hypothetical protein